MGERQQRILVMAADPEIRAACLEWQENHLVVAAADLLDGLDFLQTMRFDVVVIEYEFATHSGPLLLSAARKSSPEACRVITSTDMASAARTLVNNHLAHAYLSVTELRETLGTLVLTHHHWCEEAQSSGLKPTDA